MAKLQELVLTEEKRPQVEVEVKRLLDDQVRRKRGVSGLAIKTGYKVVKTFKPGFLDGVVHDLLPEFCDALEPLHERYVEHPDGTFGAFLKAHQDEAARALLGVTDGKAERSQNRVVKKSYKRLRSSAQQHVLEAVPGLADLMDEHYPQS